MSAMVSQTLQSAVLSMTSNVLAQAISSYKEGAPFSLNTTPVLKFIAFSIISSPPNIVWQDYIEAKFPNNVRSAVSRQSDEKRATGTQNQTSKKNILMKFLLDQTVGAVVNTLMFLSYVAYVNGAKQGKEGIWDTIRKECQEKTWPMMKDGYKFWPLVSLVSFLWIPVHQRVVFGSLVGVLWGIYLSLLVDA